MSTIEQKHKGYLKPLVQRPCTKDIIGFDVETADNNQSFVVGSLVSDTVEIFYDADKLRTRLKEKSMRGKLIASTNLAFDFLHLFDKHHTGVRLLWNGSRLLTAGISTGTKQRLTFWDTLNLAPSYSVEKMGKLLHIPKLTKPKALGRWPKNKEEMEELTTYNVQDSRISREGMRFFLKEFQALGASPKPTLASTAMSVWRNRFLKRGYWQQDKYILRQQFGGYYGGRTEAFARGHIEQMYLYDVNSLYPYVMRTYPYPDLNEMRYKRKDESVIFAYEGMAHCRIDVPPMRYPPLPVRHEHKLCFPCGVIEGTWTHAEIRDALRVGCTLLDCSYAWYSKATVEPFKEFIDELYALRLQYQREGDSREIVVKLLMNSLYGKFGQKFDARENLEPEARFTLDGLNKLDWFERIGDYIRIKKDCRPAPFCQPLWAAHITAYARMELHKHLVLNNAFYCDTDSLITRRQLPTSTALGRLKEEMRIDEGYIIRPKFYALTGTLGHGSDSREVIKTKLKGYGARLSFDAFLDIVDGKDAVYRKFIKLRESLRRGLPLNGVMDVVKHFNVEDTKRVWPAPFAKDELMWSEPLAFPLPELRTQVPVAVIQQ